jgi:hypothetical protein
MAESSYQCLAMRQGGPLEVHQTKPHIPGDDEILSRRSKPHRVEADRLWHRYPKVALCPRK